MDDDNVKSALERIAELFDQHDERLVVVVECEQRIDVSRHPKKQTADAVVGLPPSIPFPVSVPEAPGGGERSHGLTASRSPARVE